MEQRIGTSSQPLDGAGIDPAFIPGLTSPGSGEPEDAKPAEPEEAVLVDEAEEAEGAEAEDAGEPSAEEAVGGEPATEETSAEETSAEKEEAPDGPVFEASDRRARIVADHRGVRLHLDDQECEFRWDEIGAVETETARFGKRFTVTVHTPERRWYPIEIEADSRARFQEWEARLDEVLDTYFEDGEQEPAASEEDED
ncbi:hypothetical protein AAW14_33635 [Streptomyces hygroscopicus]|uniref:hypothetical protein n=1 Tax=Streptomyces hygroscopicus TaxID=1912 RepID=UPI00223F63B3|nr:hypothetical protein [Streptomyces hygroscopicus]MCW7946792.1 hypothetical protein [Streptomyces hygroscopicus]